MENNTNTQVGAASGRKPFATTHITFYIEDGGRMRKEQREFHYYELDNGYIDRPLDPYVDAESVMEELNAEQSNVLIKVTVTLGESPAQRWGIAARGKTAYSFRKLRGKLPKWFPDCEYAGELMSVK